LFRRPPEFRNALVQSITGSNTMVFNGAARDLLMTCGPATRVASHDWPLYLLTTAVGGKVIYDPLPMVRYRVHAGNVMGANTGLLDRQRRLSMLLQGPCTQRLELNLAALETFRPRMTAENRERYDLFRATPDRDRAQLRGDRSKPNYNDAARIGAALAALFGQTRPFDEIIIVDDGSTDDSADVIAQLVAGKNNVKVLRHQTNARVVAALNTGIDACSCDFLLLCSANDSYDAHVVEWCGDALARYPDAGMWLAIRCCPNGRTLHPLSPRRLDANVAAPYDAFLFAVRHGRAAAPRADALQWRRVHVRTDLVRRFGGLTPELKWHCDWFVYQRIAFDSGIVYVRRSSQPPSLTATACSSNINIWNKQKAVFENMYRLLHDKYPGGRVISPRGTAAGISSGKPLILVRDEFRWMVTPLLVWRVGVHRLLYWLKYLLPRPFMMRVRTWFGI